MTVSGEDVTIVSYPFMICPVDNSQPVVGILAHLELLSSPQVKICQLGKVCKFINDTTFDAPT